MRIPLVDLTIQYASLKEEIDAAVARVLSSGQFALGPEVKAFEEEFARYVGTRDAVGLNSGTSALYLTLLALGVGPGDEILTVSYTFFATIEAILWTGARPVFVDINEKNYTLDPAQIESRLTKKTKGILPVHLYGHPADLDPILEIAKKRKLWVLEDACQAHGALYKGKRVGSWGIAGCFSFYPTKNLGAFGEGGAVVTNDRELATRLRKLRNHGGLDRYTHEFPGTNARMEAIQGAILRVKLPHLEPWNELRRKRAQLYDSLLGELGAGLPREADYAKSAYHLYVIRTRARDRLNSFLNEQGIGSVIHYPKPMHRLDCLKHLGYREGDFPVTEKICREVLSLPLYPELTEDEIRSVVQAIRSFFLSSKKAKKIRATPQPK